MADASYDAVIVGAGHDGLCLRGLSRARRLESRDVRAAS